VIKKIIFMLIILFIAVLGKLMNGWGASRNLPRLIIGMEMVLCDEIALTIATTGKKSGIFNSSIFSAIVIMAIATSLNWSSLLNSQFKEIY